MGSLLGQYAECRRILCQTAKRRETITYGALAEALGLKLAQQNWSSVLDPIYDAEMKLTGTDLTLVVVYGSGAAKGLSRYFSNGRAVQTTRLDPKDARQISKYEAALEKVFDAYAKQAC
jgi:hypothetical protein